MHKQNYFIVFIVSLVLGCNNTVIPDAEIPKLISISTDITTSINNSVTLKVEAEVLDNGILSYQWYLADENKLKDGVLIEADDDNCICASDKCFKPDVSRSLTIFPRLLS